MNKGIIGRIPTGMHRSVENAATRAQQHPDRDASLTGYEGQRRRRIT